MLRTRLEWEGRVVGVGDCVSVTYGDTPDDSPTYFRPESKWKPIPGTSRLVWESRTYSPMWWRRVESTEVDFGGPDEVLRLSTEDGRVEG